MYTSHKEISLSDYVKEVSPYISHMHLSDSIGTDGEGIQIGEGDINWQKILKYLMNNLQILLSYLKYGKATKILEREFGSHLNRLNVLEIAW